MFTENEYLNVLLIINNTQNYFSYVLTEDTVSEQKTAFQNKLLYEINFFCIFAVSNRNLLGTKQLCPEVFAK